ncbi:MAG: hypothetical protein E7339_05250 [Clostridiales bacterium]|nr:hypothetical protein [Clostridiales bacterium]
MKRKLLSALCIVIFAIATVAMTACTPLKHTVTFVNYDGTQLYSVVVDHNAIPAYEGEAPVRAEDNLYVYEFNGWLDSEGTYYESLPVTGADVTYTASYALTAKYLAVFVNGSEVLQSETLYEGDAVVYKGETPVKAVDEQYTYTFAGWTEGGVEYPVGSELPAISGHVTYHAYFSTTNNYRINFVNGEQTLQSSLLVEGSAIAYEGETPVKEPDSYYRYEFAGWSLTEGGEIVDIAATATESLTYYAVFNSFERVYVVTFVGANGETLFSQEMNYGEVPAYNGEAPVKASDAQYHYTFSGWDKEIGAVEGDVTYTAQFSTTLREYNVTWHVNGEASTEVLAYGTAPSREDAYVYGKVFLGWATGENGEVVDLASQAIAGETHYYAVFSDTSVWNGTYPNVANGYTFSGEGTEESPWLIQSATDLAALSRLTTGKKDFGKGTYYKLTVNVDLSVGGWVPICDSNTTPGGWHSIANFFSANFDGSNKTITMKEENAAVCFGLFMGLANCTVENINFEGSITGAHYHAALATYMNGGVTVKNVTTNVDITVTDTINDAQARTGAIAGQVNGTGNALINCKNTGDITALAHQTKVGGLVGFAYGELALENCSNEGVVKGIVTANTIYGVDSTFVGLLVGDYFGTKFTITWNANGVESTSTVDAGRKPVYSGETPVKADDELYRYTFAGWSLTEGGKAEEIGFALSDLTYHAVFSKVDLYTITFTDEKGNVLDVQRVLEGECATFQGEIPTIENTPEHKYKYIGWIVDGVSYSFEDVLPEVFESATYVLEIKESINEHEIVWNVDGNLTKKDFAFGVVPTFNGTPEKAATAQYTYTFVGWSTSENGAVIEVPAVSGPATYYAVFTATVNKYTVTFLGEDGAKLQSHLLEYGTQIVFEGELPTLARTQQYTYYPAWKVGEEVIDLRTGTLPEITADVTYEFVNIAEVNQYTITVNYVVNSGAVVAPTSKSFTVDYGTAYGEAETASPAVNGFAPDRYWLAGIVFDDATYTVNYTPVTVWDGSTGTSFESGSGTASDPYIIKTGAQLAYLAKLGMDNTSAKGSVYGTGVYYKLGASIDLSGYQWTPICFRDTTTTYNWTYFDGNFDGAGHTIIMNISNTGFGYGLFQGVGPKSVVKNLTIAGKVSVKHRAGAIAYISLAGAVIDNVHNYADILASVTGGDYWVGGFLGSATTTQLTNSTNYGEVKGGSLTGGFFGTAASCTVDNSVNYGNVTGGSGARRVGGIIGEGTGTTKVTNSANFGNVTGGKVTVYKSDKTTVDYYEGSIGGIIGHANKSQVLNSANYGTVTGVAARYLGGITALSSGATVDGCVNYGEIKASGSYNGGITGTTQSASKTLNSVNYGKVTASDVNTGGISGYLGNGSRLDGCTNYGEVSGTSDVGGIAGENQSNPGVNASNYNYGAIKGTGSNIGGIVGNNTKANGGKVLNSFNYGTVTGPKYVGGIAGTSATSTTVENCENHGTISGTNQYIGGIVGGGATATVKNCKNYGFINSPKANNIAGIVGFATSTTEVILCENHGDIIAGTSSNGAIVGYLGGGATLETASKVVGCVNYGDISGTATVGGIVGLNNGYVTRYFVEGEAEVKTVNYGNVTATSSYVGGICGNTGISSNCVASMTEYAINYGTITAGKNSDSVSSVGGINGQVTNGGSIQNCENHGAVSGTGSQVGGITGYLNGTVTGCINDADVYGGGNYVGGIVGESKGTVKDVENSGNVKSYTSYIGGAVGRNNGGTVENATNRGSVTAERAAQEAGTGIGGVIGSNQNSATASKLYNYGDVIGYTQVGGISGYQGAGSSIDTAVNEGDVTGYGTVGQIVGTNNSVDLTTNASGSGVVTDLEE